jgi:tetratricopeptide (TPR) repeat protein/transglutaminase-like putative cysteine protease
MAVARAGIVGLMLLALAGGRLAAAGAEWPVARGPSREPVPYHFDAKKPPVIPPRFLEDATACVLYAGTNYTIEPDGTVEGIFHEITRLNSRKAIEKLGEHRGITWDPGHQKPTVHEACVHKPDGRKVAVEARDVHVRDVSTDFQVYDHEKQLVVTFPTLEVGDTIEVKWSVRGRNPEYHGNHFTRYTFGDTTHPILIDELRLRLPRDKPLKWAAAGGKIEPVVSESAGMTMYHWKATDTLPLPKDERLPSSEELRLSVSCSTFPSWEAIAEWKTKLRKECWQCSDDVKKVVAEVTRGLTDPVARARALTYWMRRNVRYVSIGLGHDFTPHLPGEVLANRYGDCKDGSQLLAVMLREAGLKVELVTLGTRDDGQVLDQVPSPWGTHAILVVTIDGKEHWIDTTASLSGWDFLPRDDRERRCYLVDDQGHIRLTTTPAMTPDDNKMVQTSEVWIAADGNTRWKRTVTSMGQAGRNARDDFLEVPVGERRRQVASELQDANSATHLLSLTVDEASLRDLDAPAKVEFCFEIPGQFTGNVDKEASFTDSKIWGRFLSWNLDYDREAAFELYAPFESDHRFIVHVPPTHTLESRPRSKTVRSAWGVFTLKVKPINGDSRLLEWECHTRIEKYRVEPNEFEEFRKFQQDVAKAYRVWLTIKPVTDLEDAKLLEAILTLAPEDSGTAAVLARLYDRFDRTEDARRVLKRALACNPDDATLWDLMVSTAPGLEDEEAAQRELVKRFPGELKYTVALASVLVSRGKHEAAEKLLQVVFEKGTPSQQAEAYYQLARSAYRRDKLDEALKHLRAADLADAETVNTVRVHILKGQIYEEQGQLENARLSFRNALKLNGDATFALEGLLRLAFQAGDKPEAVRQLRRYIVAVGNDFTGLQTAADYALKLGRYDDAFELAMKARNQRFNEKTQRILGLVWLNRADPAKALEHLEKASLDAVVLEGILRCLILQGNLDELANRVEQVERVEGTLALKQAAERARKLLARRDDLLREAPAPKDHEAEWRKALGLVACAEEAYHQARSPGRCQTLIDQADKLSVECGPVVGWQARLLLEKGKLSAALPLAEKALKLSPGSPTAWFVRGRVRQERGTDGALDDLQKATDLSKRKDADVLHSLASALFAAGQRKEAVTAQKQAAALRPEDKEIAEQLEQMEKALSGAASGG